MISKLLIYDSSMTTLANLSFLCEKAAKMLAFDCLSRWRPQGGPENYRQGGFDGIATSSGPGGQRPAPGLARRLAGQGWRHGAKTFASLG